MMTTTNTVHFKEVPNLKPSVLNYHENSNRPKIGFGLFGPKDCFLLKSFNPLYQPIREMEVRNDDVWICSPGKTGTTWLQEMVWLIANDYDYKGAEMNIDERFPWLEMSVITAGRPGAGTRPSFQIIKEQLNSSQRRFIKTHLPYNLLPLQIQTGEKEPKILYIARNPMDTCVSLYHHMRGTGGYLGTLDDLVEQFIDGQIMFGPFWTHLQEFWELKAQEKANFLFLTYELMKKDLESVVHQVCKFLDKPSPPPEIMKTFLHHLSFESMKSNPAVNNDGLRKAMARNFKLEKHEDFIRKGIVGGWKEEMSPDSITKMKNWIKVNRIHGIWDENEIPT